ncbi:bis(5'-nucleosyl)-tetraphosphatase (symmetrical) YqeK [Facklamia miroungae]|uniref:bis(5'-nucleosyl)-tetraphosphatase (symmetrical) n=1 Tax=Facklamia miroungae TaxID=120956 RepID=A0A1G7UIG5_9LACT|nr:bis(5'-nucleosyl)-tetraphosphatase (symmetrical) YqeK [Facklamia miroungae]NKZ30090.1 HD domain-containing protein [Facklamia miroungae]SDG47303.1 putative HD superfamily hydrolase of NAD metabolism [Facklamia miroungae]
MIEELIYQQNLINMSRQELINQLDKRLSKSRFNHVMRVEKKALELAELYGADIEKTSIVALMHDYAKEIDANTMLLLAKEFWSDDRLDEANEGIWHGFAAAQILKRDLACQDEEVIQAVAAHTTGWHQMSQIAKILYIADYTEEGRDFKGVNKVRKLSLIDLDKACLLKMRMTVKRLMKKQEYLFPLQIEVYNSWIKHYQENKVI